jgi:hypothetical protein
MRSNGGTDNRLWLYGWYQNEGNHVSLLMDEPANKWVLKQVLNYQSVLTRNWSNTINPNVSYDIKLAFDGTSFRLWVNGVLRITAAAPAPPSGNVGFQSKKTVAKFAHVTVR